MDNRKFLAKVVVGSRLHETATPESDWDYRGIYIIPEIEALSPFRKPKNTSWIEGNEDDTSYELRNFCKLATKGNATILEVFFSDKILQTSPEHQEMRENWKKFMNTKNFINASRGYAHNQYKKALDYDDMGEKGQIRTAKFIISFLRVMWQCEQYLLTDTFKCSLKECPYYEFIKQIKGTPREKLDIPQCFFYMEQMNQKLLKAEKYCNEHSPDIYNRTPDIAWIEGFILRAYRDFGPTREVEELLRNGNF